MRLQLITGSSSIFLAGRRLWRFSGEIGFETDSGHKKKKTADT
jgi:hypothetical protein